MLPMFSPRVLDSRSGASDDVGSADHDDSTGGNWDPLGTIGNHWEPLGTIGTMADAARVTPSDPK